MSNKQEQPQIPEIDKTKFNTIDIAFTDMELQFVVATLQRKDRVIQAVNMQAAESLQHFAVMTAKKKNIQFADNLFAGVNYDTKKQKAVIVLHKTPPKPAEDTKQKPAA